MYLLILSFADLEYREEQLHGFFILVMIFMYLQILIFVGLDHIKSSWMFFHFGADFHVSLDSAGFEDLELH